MRDEEEKRMGQGREDNFERVVEELYREEWKQIKEENAMEFEYMRDNVFRKIDKAQHRAQ